MNLSLGALEILGILAVNLSAFLNLQIYRTTQKQVLIFINCSKFPHFCPKLKNIFCQKKLVAHSRVSMCNPMCKLLLA